MRPQPDTTEDEYRQTLVKYQQEIGKASKVVIVGAGSVGLEVAGVCLSLLVNDAGC
jgi:NADH dehydrogenase FAD-containing subunit